MFSPDASERTGSSKASSTRKSSFLRERWALDAFFCFFLTKCPRTALCRIVAAASAWKERATAFVAAEVFAKTLARAACAACAAPA